MEASARDEEIVKCVREGDIESFGVLVERYEARLLRYARRFLSETPDAEDLVQEALVKAYENIQSFDASRRFSPWIYRIAHNEFVSALRKRSGKETVSFFDFDIVLPAFYAKEDPENEMMRKEVQEEMKRTLTNLPPKYREPLVLFYFEGMGYQEISDVMKIPMATVGVRLSRARALLKKKTG